MKHSVPIMKSTALLLHFLNPILHGQIACKNFCGMRHIKHWKKSHPITKCSLMHGFYRMNKFYFVSTY